MNVRHRYRHRRQRGLFAVFLLSALVRADGTTNRIHQARTTLTNTVEQQEHAFDDDDTFLRLVRLEKPATFESWAHRFDFVQHNLTCDMQSQIDRADKLFVKDLYDAQPVPNSRFRLGGYIQAEKDGGFKLKLDPDLETDIRIPNIERSLRIFIETQGNDDLPGTTVADRDSGLKTGLRRAQRYVNLDTGVKIRRPPVLFGRIDVHPELKPENWRIYPNQRFYWESDDGVGEVTSLEAYRFIGTRLLFRSATALRWTEKANDIDSPEEPTPYYQGPAGFQWEQSLMFVYVRKFIERRHQGRAIKLDQAANATGLQVSVFGQSNPEWQTTNVRCTFGHRRPLYKNWMYISFIPELEWKLEEHWRLVPRFRVGVDMLFWAEAAARP